MGKRLLVIDDEPEIGAYIRMVADPMGFDVEITTRAQDFLEAYEREEPSLICVDIVMPEMDGLELLRTLSQRNCRSPVLLISAYNRLIVDATKNLGQAYRLPYVRSMSKPFRVDALETGLQDIARHAP